MPDSTNIFLDFIFSPVVSAIIGAILGFFVPKGINKIVNYIKKKIDQSVDEINIAGLWNSFFGEEKNLQSETVKLEQTGRNVIGTMEMNNRVYNFQGLFKNQILVGTYESKSTKKDERGTIVLRYINENLLSGYCTFIYKNKQVYNSPYVLTLASEHKVKNGTYQFCNGCIGKFNCCCNCSEIDMPILLPFEVEKLSRITKRSIDTFANKTTNNLYQVKRVDDDENRECIFFQNNRCSIYENRPIDCRLFPFDFKEIDGDYWVIYYNKVCQAVPSNKDEIDLCAHNMRPLLEILLPYLSECSNPIFSKRLVNQEYIKLFPVNKIRDDNT